MIQPLYRRKIEVLLNFFNFLDCGNFYFRSLMELFVVRFGGATAIALTAALFGIRTTYTMLTAFFCSVKIHHRTAHNKQKNCNQNYICHNHTLTLVLFTLDELNAYSSLSFLFVLLISITTIAAIITTAIPPAIAAPTLRAAGAVKRVPIVYTR